jgi:hypothetical protein
MKNKKKIFFISHLKVRLQKTEKCSLLMMEVKGYSDNEQLGIARLEPACSECLISQEGFLELDFIIHPIKNSDFKRRDWDICPIFRFEDMPMTLKGVIIKAQTNEETILI